MKEFPNITTLLLTYRRPQLLIKAIESVLRQTHPHFQLLICDNASGDETTDIVNEYCKRDARVKYHCHATNIGMIENYKFGLASIQTDFFSILSDDDILLPSFYEIALSSLHTSDAILFAGSTIIMTAKGKVVRIPLSLWESEGVFHPPNGMIEMIGKYPVPAGIVFRKEILKHVAIDEENPLTWDCDYLLNCARLFPIIISKKPCAIFLQHSESYSFSQEATLWEKSFYRLAHRLKTSFNLPPYIAKEAKNRLFLDLYNWYMHHNAFDKASLIATQISDFIRQNHKADFNLKISRFHPIIIFAINFIRELKHRIVMKKKLQKQYEEYYKYLK